MSNTHRSDLIGDFRVSLPTPLKLTHGKYEVALTDIIYPFTYDTLSDRMDEDGMHDNTLVVRFQEGTRSLLKIVTIPPGTYVTAEDLTGAVNKALVAELMLFSGTAHRDVFGYDPITRKCRIILEPPFILVEFSRKLSYLLGIEKEIRLKETYGTHPIHLAKDFIYVYADCCEFQMLSNVMCPLLKVLNVQGVPGQNVEHVIHRPHYVPVRSAEIDSVRIELKNELNEVIPFHSGKVCVVLHFRRSNHFE